MGPFLQVSAGYPPVQGFDRFPFALLPEASAELSGFPCKGKGEAVFRKKEGWPVVCIADPFLELLFSFRK